MRISASTPNILLKVWYDLRSSSNQSSSEHGLTLTTPIRFPRNFCSVSAGASRSPEASADSEARKPLVATWRARGDSAGIRAKLDALARLGRSPASVERGPRPLRFFRTGLGRGDRKRSPRHLHFPNQQSDGPNLFRASRGPRPFSAPCRDAGCPQEPILGAKKHVVGVLDFISARRARVASYPERGEGQGKPAGSAAPGSSSHSERLEVLHPARV